MYINNYNTYIFDFDGVVIDSNFVKKKAIYDASIKYSNEV